MGRLKIQASLTLRIPPGNFAECISGVWACGVRPPYLNSAGAVYSAIGLPQKAWPLFKKTTELQPGADLFQANLATCSVYLGKIDEAITIYRDLLERFPNHRKNHYEMARLRKAKDHSHIEQMKMVLRQSDDPPDRNIFLYYALGEELEDLECWDESFEYYKRGGDAATSISDYHIETDIRLIDKIIDVCDADWITENVDREVPYRSPKKPIFIVGLPRTGTTLTERIVSSHSQVNSLGETLFLQMHLRRESGVNSVEQMLPEMIDALIQKDISRVARNYLESVSYRLGAESLFIDKFPSNCLYLGFIAKAWPDARIIHLVRNPMDSCFSMY